MRKFLVLLLSMLIISGCVGQRLTLTDVIDTQSRDSLIVRGDNKVSLRADTIAAYTLTGSTAPVMINFGSPDWGVVGNDILNLNSGEIYITDDGITTANRMSILHTGSGGTFEYNGATRMAISSGGTTISSFLKVPSGAHIGSTNAPAGSVMLEVSSTSKGFLPPRMTGAQGEAISTPEEGLLIYATSAGSGDITSKGWWGFDGTNWVKLN